MGESEELMAWLQDALRASARRQIGGGFKYGISTTADTIDLDYSSDGYTVSLVRIVAGREGFRFKRFAGPKSEAYEEANDWRKDLND